MQTFNIHSSQVEFHQYMQNPGMYSCMSVSYEIGRSGGNRMNQYFSSGNILKGKR